MGSMGEWEELVDALAKDLIPSIHRQFYRPHMDRVRGLGAPSEKLVYFFLVHSEPQSFSTIRRALSMSSRTVDRALRILLKSGFVSIDRRYLYWVSPPQPDN